ncbi:MAG: hypothetical protein LBG27_05320, partial [Spirochaetaceae bacterium]|nr:hypothetical protein [Spirochaetaceae bacterium]
TPPLGAVKTGGAGDLFPRIRKDFKGKSSIPRRLRRGFLFAIIYRGEMRDALTTNRAMNRLGPQLFCCGLKSVSSLAVFGA